MDRDQQRLGSVVQWLSSTDLSEPTIPRRRRKKRKRSPTGASAVPDSLEPSMAAPTHHQSTPGRKKRIQETSDVNATPRAVGLPDDTNSQSISLSSLSDVGSIATSTTSRRSSPIKQLRAVSLFDDGFIHRKFTDTSHLPPPELAALAQDLETIGMGVGVLPRTVKVNPIHPLATLCRCGTDHVCSAFSPARHRVFVICYAWVLLFVAERRGSSRYSSHFGME